MSPVTRVPWTTGERERLRTLRESGASQTACAAALNRSRGSVSGQLVRMGLARRLRFARRAPGELLRAVSRFRGHLGATAMADALGVSRCTVYTAIARLPGKAVAE